MLNAPGSWHDSRVARSIYYKLLTQTPPGYYLVADTAFPRGTLDIEGRIKATMKAGQSYKGTQDQIERKLAFDRQLLSYRQTAEWGMRALQGSFGRLRVPLEIKHENSRASLLETCVRLHNLRSERIGMNQIRTVYFEQWMQSSGDGQVWRAFESMLFSDQRRNDRVARFYLDVVYEN